MILFWLLPIVVILHIIEEFLFPGGFMAWYRNYKTSISSSVTAKYIIIINLVLVVLCVIPIFMKGEQAVSLWLSMASVLFFNALFHINGVIKLKKYSPGTVTSILLYIPLPVCGYYYFISKNFINTESALAASVVGVLYLWFSAFNHRRRAKKGGSRENT